MRGGDFYLHAFWELSTCRNFGYAIGPIPWHRIVQYGSRKGLDDAMMGIFEHVIRELDEAYLEWQRTEQKQRTKK